MTQQTEPSGTPESAGPAIVNEAPVAPGTVLAGKYRVERVIGKGGMGVVVEARHIALDDRVALKFLTASYAQHPEATARFLREGKAAVKIKSEHVARVSDVGTLENGAPYMVMEFLEGNDLSQELQTKGVLGLQDAVDYVIQASEALSEAHAAGIVHRDIKPANLFLTRRHDGSALVKVLDFGISKMAEGVENLTKTMTAMGSALYMSPEQMQQTRGVDHRTDIYALGIALYELLAGKQPFYADTLPQLCAEVLTGTPTPLAQIRPDLPAALGAVLEKAYARDRAVRYATIADFVIALAPFAPPRSQPNIDRVARAAGQQAPIAGSAPLAPPPAPAGPPRTRGGTIAMEQRPVAGGTVAIDAPLAPARPPQGSSPVIQGPAAGYPAGPAAPGPGQAISPDPAAPAGNALSTGKSVPPGQAVSNGQGAAPGTAPGLVIATPTSPPVKSRTPLIVAAALLAVGIGAAAAFFVFNKPSAAPASADTGALATPPPKPTAEPPEAPTTAVTPATTATTAAPEASASAQPVTTAQAKPTASASASTKPTAAPKGTGTKPKSIFDDR